MNNSNTLGFKVSNNQYILWSK